MLMGVLFFVFGVVWLFVLFELYLVEVEVINLVSLEWWSGEEGWYLVVGRREVVVVVVVWRV